MATQRTSSSGARGIRQGGAQYERIHRELAKAALLVISERGYGDFSVDEAAARADVAVRTAYRHYATKLDLALAAIATMPDFSGWLDGEDSAADRLRRGVTIVATYREYFAPLLATCLVHRRSEPALLRALRSRVIVPRMRAIESYVADGIASGELRPNLDPRALSAIETGIQMSIASGTMTMGRGRQKAEALFDLIWPTIAADDHA